MINSKPLFAYWIAITQYKLLLAKAHMAEDVALTYYNPNATSLSEETWLQTILTVSSVITFLQDRIYAATKQGFRIVNDVAIRDRKFGVWMGYEYDCPFSGKQQTEGTFHELAFEGDVITSIHIDYPMPGYPMKPIKKMGLSQKIMDNVDLEILLKEIGNPTNLQKGNR